jgi:hypothetical protein
MAFLYLRCYTNESQWYLFEAQKTLHLNYLYKACRLVQFIGSYIMSKNKNEIIEYLKLFYPNSYKAISNSGKLSNEECWKIINSEIKYSKQHHHGIDMSALQSLLSTVKAERVALNLLPESTQLYERQWEQVERFISEGIDRHDLLPPYTLQRIHEKTSA